MKMFLKLTASFAVLALAGACSSMMGNSTPVGPSPRAECAPAQVTVYFTEDSPTIQPTTMPLLHQFMDQIASCKTAGGTLRSITIVPYADPGATRQDADQQMSARSLRVRNTLVEFGAPNSAIRVHRPSREASPTVMGRRAEVSADLW
jgi:outer membrane protein OmpA-like peptidoglycan-associated protein